MKLKNIVDPDEWDPTSGVRAIPAGVYKVAIISNDGRPTKDGNGAYLQINMQVTDGDYINAAVIDRLNIDNPNAQTESWAYNQLRLIFRCCGLPAGDETDVLDNCECAVRLGVRPARTDDKTGQTYEASNEIKHGHYFPLEDYEREAAAFASTNAPVGAAKQQPKSGGFGTIKEQRAAARGQQEQEEGEDTAPAKAAVQAAQAGAQSRRGGPPWRGGGRAA